MNILKHMKSEKTVPVIKDDYPTFLERWLQTTSSTSKQLMWFLVINAVIWIYMSYLLAWFGRDQIAESLSTNVCTVILGGIIAYLTSSTIQNLSKYNPKLGGVPTHIIEPLDNDTLQEEVSDTDDIVEEATVEMGINVDEPVGPDPDMNVTDPGEGIIVHGDEVVG